ncbi:hypothetical protein KSP40_PGU021337 [Platanthera guangdongensis]|uniref:1,4-dihydroxy-2-naphthoate octaprenyltransferase n=1 Tax=Platanthera guangdongensis TaxID=2320717 RepID=A0ABR2N5T6_9ASPA
MHNSYNDRWDSYGYTDDYSYLYICIAIYFATVSLPVIRCKRWTAIAHRHLPTLQCSSHSPAGNPIPAKKKGEQNEVSRPTLIWRAIKLPIYSVTLVPLTVSSAAAYHQTGLFSARCYLLLLLASVLIITWLNLSNDVYDYDTGVDQNKKESVVNMIGSRTEAHSAAILALVFGFMGIIWAFTEAEDIRFILLVTSAILWGYIYQCPPFRLSYHGLGEPLCFASFGPFATTAFYFSQSSKNAPSSMPSLSLNSTILCASVLVGLTTTFILFCRHFHQIDGDKAVGKMSPLVRVGAETGSKLIRTGILLLYALLLAFTVSKSLPLTSSILCAITIPTTKLVVEFVEQNHNNEIKISMAKYYFVRLHSLFGALLAAGLMVARGELQS